MKSLALTLALASAAAVLAAPAPLRADAQAAIDGCIDQLRRVGGPDAQAGGTVLGQEWSQAGTLVRLRDAGGTVWECIGYDDGAVGSLRVVGAADDGGGAMAGAASPGGEQRIRFAAGTSGTQLSGTLAPGRSMRYVLGARKGQFLRVSVQSRGGALDYRIFNPDRSALLDLISSDKPYRGQLWQSGDHVVEVVNAGARPVSYDMGIGID
ncbi:hypothetical protein [Rhodovulum euryhalinum]|uniref:Secreted protein n=1 Tax=Rhodovulum euryhalinum TaxID=35805 RepID=A0A4R2KEU7_9RHOB|nr:hypothetical protein [Rhodovulum euryhalinum]TCO71554.1 hypothetical protein EV655_10646 [Rhodovulum euryhalinum]